MDFIDFKVFTDRWTHLERLGIVSYNAFANAQTYGTFDNIYDVHDFIDEAQQVSVKTASNSHLLQKTKPPSLRRALDILISSELVVSGKPSNAIIFVSSIDEQSRKDAQPSADVSHNLRI
jgi:hypothetical protein